VTPQFIQPLCRFAAALCAGDEDSLREAVNLALDQYIPVSMLREVVLTSYLFDGYPTALEGFRILSSISGLPKSAERDRYTPEDVSHWRERGERLCRMVYGPQFERLTEHILEIAPELAEAMIIEGYGKVLSRPGLDVRLRELCVVTILACKGRERQLLSHILGSLRLGASEENIATALNAAESLCPVKRIARARKVLKDAIQRHNMS